MKVPKRLGTPIASRELVRDGSDKPIQVFVWKPFRVRDEEWSCPYQIKGLGTEVIRYSYGSDAMQALQLSFERIRADLNPRENKIYWLVPDIGDAGFPRTVPYALGADVYEYLCALMDREIVPFGEDLGQSKKARVRIRKWMKQAASGRTPRRRGGDLK